LLTRALIFLVLCTPAWGAPTLVFESPGAVRVIGLDLEALKALKQPAFATAELSRAFAVYFEDATTAILGDYEVDARGLRFTPRFPFTPGRMHRAIFDSRAFATILHLQPSPVDILRLSFVVDAPEQPATTRVVAVYPSGDSVPANLLRVYILFSRPMSRRGIADHVKLLGESGEAVEHPFLNLEQDLWDPSGQRLTLIFDPGRIKRGLALHENKGLPLRAGGRYRLVISADAKDAEGKPLAEAFSKEYRVLPAERSTPDPRRWRIAIPRVRTREQLLLVADRALDQPLFERLVRVEDEAGLPLEGEATVRDGGTRWCFSPAQPWRPGGYRLRVGAELEDLAGNRPTRLFDEPADPSGIRKEAQDVLVPLKLE